MKSLSILCFLSCLLAASSHREVETVKGNSSHHDVIHSISDEEVKVDSTMLYNEASACIYYDYPNWVSAQRCFDSLQNNKWNVDIAKLTRFLRNVNHFEQTDWFYSALCFCLMPADVIKTHIDIAAHIVGGFMKARSYYHIFRYAYWRFNEIIAGSNSSFTVATPNLAIITWYPFQNNFSGIAWYKGNNLTSGGYIEKIPSNLTLDSINKNDLKIAIYVPDGFIKNLTAESELNIEHLFIVLTIMEESSFLVRLFKTNMYDIVGIRIPGFCKRNELSILQVLYEDGTLAYEHGNKYFDSANPPRNKCMLSTTTYFARIRNRTSFFESARTRFCLRFPIGKTHFPQTPMRVRAYPESFCVNGKAEIPFLYCHRGIGSWRIDKSMDLECVYNYSISAHTEQVYKAATQCYKYDISDTLTALNSTNLATIDKRMMFYIFRCIANSLNHFLTSPQYATINIYGDVLFPLLNTALGLFREPSVKLTKATDVIDTLYFWIDRMQYSGLPPHIRKKYGNYIYERVPSASPVVGAVLYKRGSGSFKQYEVKPLTKDNATDMQASDQSVEVIFYAINNESARNYDEFSYFIMHPDLYNENDTIKTKSRILVIHSTYEIEFRIFLRAIGNEDNWMLNYYTGEGYWFNTSVDFVTSVRVIENNTGNYCETSKAIELLKFKDSVDIPSRTTDKKIDLLSMLSMSVNNAEGKTETEEIYNKYSWLLEFFRMLGSALSLVGIAILFITALVLKNWRKTRFYTIQLMITLTFQIVLFIAEAQIEEISQAGFFTFYYFILSQFFWMSLIGYKQYLRFIKVFNSKTLGVVKALAVGWLLPGIVVTSSLIFYSDCLKCNLCYKNTEIFVVFVLVPVGVIVVINLIVYIFVMINIWSNEGGASSPRDRKLTIRATIFLPFLMGITWIFVFALLSPWSWLFIAGLFFIHLIIPSQALILCVFVVLLDKSTREQWKKQVKDMFKKQK